MKRLLLSLLLTSLAGRAAVVYNNTDVDQQFSVIYSTGYTHIGDRIQLTSQSLLTSLDTQFFNAGTDGATFDATVTFYSTGSPVGSQIGTSFTVTGISIASFASQTVTFANLGDLLVPADLIVTISVDNVSSGGDIGLNFFDPPSTGTSSNTFFIANDGTGLAEASTLLDIDNLYLQVNGTAVSEIPEPATVGITLGALIVLAAWQRRRMP